MSPGISPRWRDLLFVLHQICPPGTERWNRSGSRSLLCFFFSRPLSFPVTQSYLISWTATREEDPIVLMLIRAVGRQLSGLEEPERRQETWSNTVTENLLQQAERHEGNQMWNCIWSDFEICWMSRGISIREEMIYELYLLHAGQHLLFKV